ncbi:MAG: RagB/SusD family nutrient uptake outer membrane protein [Prevotella sp.]|nr:RagB/SusD family nutrient uptake outer membrane protein [Prevotella sp.]
MKLSNIKYIALSMLLGMSLASCGDFLDRPNEDGYNDGNYFQNDAQTRASVNSLYNSPWYDFLSRGYYKIPEVMSGNLYMGGSPYLTFTVNGSDDDIKSTSASLWAVNAQANTIYNRLKTANASETVKNAAMGECLAWKAMAYFYLVRIFGEVPIVHDNSGEIAAGNYNEKVKVQAPDLYEYIVMTLEKAIELLPEKNEAGRIDKWGAKGLLAKVYLAKSGINANGNGQRDAEDLAKAASYAKDVIDNSGKELMANYEDIFKGENNKCEESLFGWRWSAEQVNYTCGNCLFSELGMVGFDEFQSWGDWSCPSVDLQDAFGVSALDNPSQRADVDTRRKATMMMAGDTYSYWWQDKGGFDYLRFLYDKAYAPGSNDGLQSVTGANIAKHQYGNNSDHQKTFGISAAKQCSSLATHVLRLSDVYLIYAEAKIGNAGSTSDASAIDAFYKVRHRAVSSYERPSSITLDEVLKERRLEFALEGDYWFDLVRMSYYDVNKAMDIINNQRRNEYFGLGDLYKAYYESNTWVVTATQRYNTDTPAPHITKEIFTLPFPDEDVVYNPHLNEPAQHVDVRAEYAY